MTGFSTVKLAKEFNCHVDTITRNLNMAIKLGLFEKLQEEIFERVAPKAMDALVAGLEAKDNNSTLAAIEIFKGIGLLTKQSERQIPQGEGEESLEIYMTRKRAPQVPTVPPEFLYDQTTPQTIDQTAGVRFIAPTGTSQVAQSLQPLDGVIALEKNPGTSDDPLADDEYSDDEFDESD